MEVDSSDLESDAGASPSSDSDDSSASSRCSSPGALKIVCPPQSTPRKRTSTPTSSTNKPAQAPPVASSSSSRPTRRKSQTPNSKSTNNTSGQKTPSTKPGPQPKGVLKTPRKRKCGDGNTNANSNGAKSAPATRGSPASKRCRMNQRRRTKSERNTRAGKAPPPPAVDETVVLDPEIDKYLEAEALKNNLTATNVKSILRHVITNNLVQKMVMSTVKTKTGNPDDSSEEEACFEPKLTRARTKLLLEKQTPPLWTIVASPAKALKKNLMSETHALIHEELPEDSSGDEEYIPREDETHSDDESSSVASHTSDVGSPQVTTPGSGPRRRDALSRASVTPNDKTPLFKAPPPLKPKCVRRINDSASAIGRRTRSKLPLNDTALEDLEMQLIPPDITPDMYDWGLSDNEDYLEFVKEFLCPGQNVNEVLDDDDADPEYNVMEDEEEHDKEELRMDRAVKVTKKELNELVAELLEESHNFSSGEEVEETDYSSLVISQQLANMSQDQEAVQVCQSNSNESSETTSIKVEVDKNPGASTSVLCGRSSQITEIQSDNTTSRVPPSPCTTINLADLQEETGNNLELPITPVTNSATADSSALVSNAQTDELSTEMKAEESSCLFESLFNSDTTSILHHQMRQHVQLLAQSYVLTASIDEPYYKNIAKSSKRLIIELNNFASANGERSNFRAANLDPAWQLVNLWPHKSSNKTPIKKKILEEKYINDYQNEVTAGKQHFPRHVVKIVSESLAFCFPDLLPKCYDQNLLGKTSFTTSEDWLLISGMADLRELKLTTKEQSELISQTTLSAKTPRMVYHRIRNLRKKNQNCAVANAYFKDGILPKGTSIDEIKPFFTCPMISLEKECLPKLWICLFSRLQVFSELNWKPEDVFHSASSKKSRKKTKSGDSEKRMSENGCAVTLTFPLGMELVQRQKEARPDLTAVPLLNINGDPGAYMFIPNYAMPPPGHNSSPQGTEAKRSRLGYHPVPFYEPNIMSSSPQKFNDEVNESSHLISLTPVGQPFSLEGMNSDVIHLASLNTPLKKAIMEHVQPQEDIPREPRTEHSARTVGYYARGTARDMGFLVYESFSETDDESVNNFVEEDVNLTELELEENSQASVYFGNTPIKEVKWPCVEIDDDDECESPIENVIRYPTSPNNGSKVQEGGENGGGSSKSQGNKENSTRSEKSTTRKGNNKDHTTTIETPSTQNLSGGRDDEDDDNSEDKPRKKGPHPADFTEDVERDEDTEEEQEVAHSSKTKPTPVLKTGNRTSKRNPKKVKRSPGHAQPKKRTPKTTPVEKMLEVDKGRDEEVLDAFVQAFILKIQAVTEARHPGLHNEFMKLISDDIETEAEFVSRVKSLLKDYPELVAEFVTFIEVSEAVPVEDRDFSDHQEMQAQLNFLRHLEKFTENSPQLKAKILHKFKVLKEEPDVTEKDVAEALAPFFQGNPVMMDAFKALYPSIYRPESIVDPNDFEEIDMESEDLATGQEDSAMELVKLPEEKNVPATNTCACQCHETGTHAYSSRVKHCNKCCLKDGKVFVHNGRVIRPVNVELKSPTSAQKILNGNTCRNCIEPSKSKESPPVKTKDVDIMTLTAGEDEEDDLEDGEIVEEDGNETKQKPAVPSSSKSALPVEKPSEEKSCDTKVLLKPWTIDEDRIILTTCESEPTLEDSFALLTSLLPNRDITEIESRCVELISLLQQSINEDGGEAS